jgi:hypothetical protein
MRNVILFIFLLIAAAQGTMNLKTWNPSAAGYFDVDANWNPSGAPVSSDSVVMATAYDCTLRTAGACSTFILPAGYTGKFYGKNSSFQTGVGCSVTPGGGFAWVTGGTWTNIGDGNLLFYTPAGGTYSTATLSFDLKGKDSMFVKNSVMVILDFTG